jgi:LuxR family maltose regulon positive regulatory protein
MNDFFFSHTMVEKMNRILTEPLTVVEAPAGYGKTTAVKKALENTNGKTVHWYTAVENIQDDSFSWLIRQLGTQDEVSAERLRSIGFLNRTNASAAADVIRNMKIEEPMYLVVDNFQYIVQDWQPQVVKAMTERGQDGLHFILISQNYGRLRLVLSEIEHNILYLTANDLLLDKEDIRLFAEQLGININDGQVNEIFKETEGWAVAVSLYLQNMEQWGGKTLKFTDTDDMLNELLWKRITESERTLLLRLCVFNRLNERLIRRTFPDEDTRGKIIALLPKVPLVGFNDIRREYDPHEILLKFLRHKLNDSDMQFCHEVYHDAGEYYREAGKIKAAVNCYWHADDYEGILSCDLEGLISENFDGVSYTEIARTVLQKVDDVTQKKYLISILRLCYAVYAATDFSGFEKYIKHTYQLISETGDPNMMGEWLIVSAFSDFPNIDKMKEKYIRADKMLDRKSLVFTFREPFMFGCTSMWYLFYSKPGKMMETADKFAEMMTIYNKLTDNHGAGAAELYRGEAYSVQGRFEESEIQAYQAAFLSEQSQNATVTYGSALLLGINAIYQSDMVALQKAIEYLENKSQAHPAIQGRSINTIMVETVRGYLLGLMMETGRSAVWAQGEADTLTDLTFSNFMVKTCRITDLILKKEYRRAIASVEASLKMDPRLISCSTRNFMYVGLALCYMATGHMLKASEFLSKSLEIAGQDKNYTFLACFRRYFSVLFMMPPISSKYATVIYEIKHLDIHYTRADESRIFSMLDEEPDYSEILDNLTDKEREIAQLAAKGMRNSEISEKLHISENTVKYHLKTIFQKMNIDRRSRLVELLK